ncbi:MAG: ABC-F type ribosomal protection protein [Clostridia bacterium]|nr:ABC-F type ribosomal protection protein [Clostridia bacterium]NCC43025.1 ABC-F type ribosomal protection protein [Clostridia bacterium]
MSQVQVSNLTFGYDGAYDMIFENVSFMIDTDWKLGMIGRNGRGKTTFLRLLMGEYEYRGTISASVGFDYFPFVTGKREELTIDLIEEVDPGYELWKVCREMNLMSADCEILYRPFDTLSNGEQTKVQLAVLFAKEQEFLLIDEPTNHLDQESRKILQEYLRKKKGFLLVSHDRMFLDGCVDHILAINRQDITVTKGNFTTWWENKKNQDELEKNQNELLKKEIGQLREAARRAEGWSEDVEKSKKGQRVAGLRPDRGYIGHKSAKMMKRAKGIESRAQDALEEKQGLLKNIETAENLKLFPLTHHKEVLVNLEDVTIGYGEHEVLSHVNMKVKNGERKVLRGPNGCGKTSIFKVILGQLEPKSGVCELGGGMKISYVPQDTSWMKGSLEEFGRQQGVEETLFKALLRKLDLSREQFDKDISQFSEGQKKKVLIAKSLCEQAHLYLWDEPMNYIDIFSRMQIEELIRKWKPTMLLIEHDEYFVREIGGEEVRIFRGMYR